MKNIPFLLQAIVAVLLVTCFAVFDVSLLGRDIITTSMNIAFAITSYLFIGHAFWSQTVGDMRRSFDDLDNQRMLTQLSARSGSMLIPMITVFLFWPAFALMAKIIAVMEDTSKGPLAKTEGFGGF